MSSAQEPPGRLVPSEATARYVRDRYGLDCAPVLAEVARGLCGRVWRLGASDTRFALKELFWDDDQDEQEIRRRTAFEDAAREAGVSCPRSLPTKEDTYLCRLPAHLGDVYVRVQTWAEGTPATEEAAPWAGHTLALLHRLRHPAVGPSAAKWDTVPTTAQWQQLTEALHRERVPWVDRLEAALPAVADLSDLVVPADLAVMVMCHLDFTPDNVLRDSAGRCSLVDWELAGPGSVERELADVVMHWAVPEGVPRPATIEALMTAYRRAGGPASIRELSSFGAHLAASINHLHTQGIVAIAAGALPEHRELAHSEVDAVLRRLPTRAVLTQVAELANRTAS